MDQISSASLDWPVSAPVVLRRAFIRTSPADFCVDEIPPCEPAGRGEHLWLQLRKTGLNTMQVVERLSKAASLHPRFISFAGMKDRHAVTTQWFSLHLPGKPDPALDEVLGADLELLAAVRHDRKLQRGALRGNRFVITLRQCEGDRAALQQRLVQIAGDGVPDYFGEQRFGRDGQNLRMFDQLLSGNLPRDKEKRGILFSSVRSWLFNQVLAGRVRNGSWNCLLRGEAVMLQGSHSLFIADEISDELRERVRQGDLHPTGPLPGEAAFTAKAEALQLETELLAEYLPLIEALATQRVNSARRPLRIIPAGLDWQWLDETSLQLSFTLPAGAYATAVLRELALYEDRHGKGP